MFIPQSEWTLRRYREDQAEIPAEFTDQELLRAMTAYTRLAAVHTKATKVAAQWSAIGVWIVALAVLAALLGLITRDAIETKGESDRPDVDVFLRAVESDRPDWHVSAACAAWTSPVLPGPWRAP